MKITESQLRKIVKSLVESANKPLHSLMNRLIDEIESQTLRFPKDARMTASPAQIGSPVLTGDGATTSVASMQDRLGSMIELTLTRARGPITLTILSGDGRSGPLMQSFPTEEDFMNGIKSAAMRAVEKASSGF